MSASVHDSLLIRSCDNIEGVLDVLQLQYELVFAPFHDHGNINSPQHTGHQVQVETVGFSGQIGAEKRLGGSAWEQSYGDKF